MKFLIVAFLLFVPFVESFGCKRGRKTKPVESSRTCAAVAEPRVVVQHLPPVVAPVMRPIFDATPIGVFTPCANGRCPR